MRFVSVLALAFLVACGSSSDVAIPPQTVPIAPPRISDVEGGGSPHFGALVVAGAPSHWEMSGFSLNLTIDVSDVPAVSVKRSLDALGQAVDGPSVPVTGVTPRGIQPGTGFGVVDFDFTPLLPGVYDVTIVTTAGTDTLAGAVSVLPPYAGQNPQERFFCGDQPFRMIAPGTIVGVGPDISGGVFTFATNRDLQGATTSVANWAVEVADCAPFPAEASTSLQFRVCQQSTILYPGAPIEVRNGVFPQHPAVNIDSFTGSGSDFDLFLEFSSKDPGTLDVNLDAAPLPLTMRFGGSFLVDGASAPAVTLDGAPLPATPSGCSTSVFQGRTACQQLELSVPKGLAPGPHTLVATSLSGCTAQQTFNVHARPVITSTAPAVICLGDQFHETDAVVTGTGFVHASLLVDGQVPPFSGCGATSCSVRYSSLSPGVHTLAVRSDLNVAALSDPVQIVAHAGPLDEDFTTPRTLLAGRPMFVPTLLQEGVVTSAEVRAQDGDLVATAGIQQAAGGAQVTVPAGIAPGTYFIRLHDESPCVPFLAGKQFTVAASPILITNDFSRDAVNFDYGPLDADGTFHPGDDFFFSATGNPNDGLGFTVADGAAPHSVRRVLQQLFGQDVGVLRFDLSSCPSGAARGAQVEIAGQRFDGAAVDFRLTREIDPPGCAFTHYDLATAGWTYQDATGSRPAVPADFAQSLTAFYIPTVFHDAGGTTILDNVSLELAR